MRRDVEQVYAGLYLDAVTSLENVIEELFIGLLVGRIRSVQSNTVPRVTFKSSEVAREVVFGGQNYVDWLPIDRTEKRAKAFFRNGTPFTNTVSYRGTIEGFLSVRNAIAHKSSHSQRVFEQRMIDSMPLISREKTPAGYLRSIYRSAPTATRYEYLVSDMGVVARELCL